MPRDARFTVRNPANGARVRVALPDGVSVTRGENIVGKNKRSTRHTDPTPDPVPADIVSPGIIVSDIVSDVPADTLIGTVPANVPADTYADAFRVTFPNAVTVPAWIDPACRTIRSAWDSVPADVRPIASYRTWIDAFHAADPTPAPPDAHRYTFGSGSDIARTQNALYIACMIVGIPRKRIPDTFGAALWRFVLGGPFDPADTGIGGYRGRTRCDYAAHADYFASTLGRYIAHDHNDTPGIVNVDAENAVRVWANAKPEPEPEPAE